MPLEVGSRLGSYSVTAKIGEGGMGEVYRARDTKLDRPTVADFRPRTKKRIRDIPGYAGNGGIHLTGVSWMCGAAARWKALSAVCG